MISRNKIRAYLTCFQSIFDKKAKIAVLVYHRVLPEVKFDPFGMVISLKTFARHMEYLAKRYPIISLEDAVRQCQSGRPERKDQIVLTFDDGFRDNYDIVFPILKRKGLPAAFFINTDYVNTDTVPWYWEISRYGAGRAIFDRMKASDLTAINKELAYLKEKKGLKEIDNGRDDICVTWAQAQTMAEGGMSIGSHAASHRSLTRIPFEEAVDDIKKSKAAIEKNINVSCDYFSFPFGGASDYNKPLIDYIKKAGYKACLLNIHGYNHLTGGMPVFNRIIMD